MSGPGVDHGVDLDVLLGWLDAEGLGAGPVTDVRPLGGGTQNIMLRLRRGDRDLVLRRGPRHLRPRSNDALRREIRVLAGLAGTDVPHPRLVAACLDTDVLDGAVFYLMEPVDGFNPALELPEPYAGDPALRHRAGLAVARALAAYGAVDHEAVGLGDLGKPVGFLERQVERWRGELASYSSLAGYAGPDLPGVDALGDWLDAHRPVDWTPGLIHGDYHLANVMLTPTSGDVAAIVDLEMATVGDPLLDLGALLATWPRGDDVEVVDAAIGRAGGLPTREELVRHYGEHSTRDLGAVDWYVAMACFKLGIVLEGTYARSRAGLAPRDVGDRLHAATLVLLRRAREVAGV
ncbi:phosphotransferase family protein [Nocardioides sp. 1609]|uniref:phosphotransferase family protein n=1 Tax=Nocardioides sp. 1609 TaxID=2508327 RepID=UPI00106F9192|nr:phosphotransferase family protein [Nocardioides sp. 1609]